MRTLTEAQRKIVANDFGRISKFFPTITMLPVYVVPNKKLPSAYAALCRSKEGKYYLLLSARYFRLSRSNQRCGILLHELLHRLLEHITRSPATMKNLPRLNEPVPNQPSMEVLNRARLFWNLITDCYINEWIKFCTDFVIAPGSMEFKNFISSSYTTPAADPEISLVDFFWKVWPEFALQRKWDRFNRILNNMQKKVEEKRKLEAECNEKLEESAKKIKRNEINAGSESDPHPLVLEGNSAVVRRFYRPVLPPTGLYTPTGRRFDITGVSIYLQRWLEYGAREEATLRPRFARRRPLCYPEVVRRQRPGLHIILDVSGSMGFAEIVLALKLIAFYVDNGWRVWFYAGDTRLLCDYELSGTGYRYFREALRQTEEEGNLRPFRYLIPAGGGTNYRDVWRDIQAKTANVPEKYLWLGDLDNYSWPLDIGRRQLAWVCFLPHEKPSYVNYYVREAKAPAARCGPIFAVHTYTGNLVEFVPKKKS